MGNRSVAHTEGPASVYHNPALLTGLSGTHIEIGTTIIQPSTRFESAETGARVEKEREYFFPSTLFTTVQAGDGLTAGLGVFSPFGLGSDWGNTWEGRYLATRSRLRTININPCIAWQTTPHVSLGAGVTFLFLDASLEKNINLSSFGLRDGFQKFEGEGTGMGFNAAIACRLNERWSLGGHYRSRIDVDADGKAQFDLPGNTPPSVAALFPNTEATTVISLPDQLFLGFCYQFQSLTVELGGRWQGWSSYEELVFAFDRPVAGGKTSRYPKQWHDTFGFGLGVKYEISEIVALLGGLAFEKDPVPDATLEPALPVADKYSASLGVKNRIGAFTVSVAYQYDHYERREKATRLGADLGGTANGTYLSHNHIAAVSLAWAF